MKDEQVREIRARLEKAAGESTHVQFAKPLALDFKGELERTRNALDILSREVHFTIGTINGYFDLISERKKDTRRQNKDRREAAVKADTELAEWLIKERNRETAGADALALYNKGIRILADKVKEDIR